MGGAETMTANFDNALTFTLRFEGVDSDDPRDPGGRTRFGISSRGHPDLDIPALTRDQARDVYYREYWLPLDLDALPEELAKCVFDTAVNAGPKRAVRWLQQALNRHVSGITLAVDGRIGPKTQAACVLAEEIGNLASVTKELLFLRLSHYARLAASPRFRPFLRGWLVRTLALNEAALNEAKEATA
jgi:lysozyme family protein